MREKFSFKTERDREPHLDFFSRKARMIRRLHRLCLLSLCVGWLSISLAQAPIPIRIASSDSRTQSFRDDELPGIATWIGLYNDRQGFQWKFTECSLQWAPDPYTEDNHSKWSAKKLVVLDHSQPVLLVQGLDGLVTVRPQKAEYTDKSSPEGVQITEKGLPIRFGQANFVLQSVPAKKSTDKSTLILSSRGQSQIIDATLPPTFDYGWSLLWAGDLDGDGRLDLIIHYADNVFGSMQLLLSSRSNPGELVHNVAHRNFGYD
jgi:hypothetical protein